MLDLLCRVTFTCLVGAIRLACWLLALMIVWTAALVALVSSTSAARRRALPPICVAAGSPVGPSGAAHERMICGRHALSA